MADTLVVLAARNLAAERTRRRWTQEELAARVGWKRNRITRIEIGKRRVTLDDALVLCRALGVPLVRLLDGMAQDDLLTLGLQSGGL